MQLGHVLAASAIGVWMAAQLGPALTDASFLIPMSALSLLFAGSFALRLPLVRAASIASGIVTGAIAIALTLVNLGAPNWILPPAFDACKALAVCIVAAFAMAAFAQWLKTRISSIAHVRWTLRGILAALYLLFRAYPI